MTGKKRFDNRSASENWLSLKTVVHEAMCKFIPKRNNKNNKLKPKWMSYKALIARRTKCSLWRKYRSTKNEEDYYNYKKAHNCGTKEIRLAKKNFEKKLADNIKTDPKSLYSYTRSKMKTKDRVGPLFYTNDIGITDDQIAADELNNFFSSIFTKEYIEIIPQPVQMFQEEEKYELSDSVLTEEEILKSLFNLKPNKAPGTDKMLTNVMREVANEAAVPLEMIFRASIDNADLPEDWRTANVTPL